MPPQAASTSIAGSPPSAFSTAGESVGSPSPPPPGRAPPRTPAKANSSSLPPHSTSFRLSQLERRHRSDPAFLTSHPVHVRIRIHALLDLPLAPRLPPSSLTAEPPTPRGARTQPGRPPVRSRETRSRRTTHGGTAAAGGSTSPDGGAVPPTPRGARTQPGRPPVRSRETRSWRTTDGGTAVAGGSTSPDGGGGSLERPGDKRSRSILLLVVIVIVIILASFSSRNREIGDRCSSDADCVSGLSCYNWNGFTGKKCVRTTIANPFNTVSLFTPSGIASSSSRNRELGDRCSSDADCVSGLSCYNWNGFTGKKCVRTTTTNPFNTVDTSVPFNKYAFLTTHNSFSITGVTRFTFYNQEDSVTDQLNNGVRALMLDVYDLRDDIWLCHSFGGKCFYPNAFEPAIYTMREIEAFLLTNPSEIVTLILEDHVTSHHGLSKLFNKTGLMKYWFPVSRMPRDGEDWPRVSDMIKLNHRLLVFTSNRSKELSEEIAYQWNYMVENQYGDGGMDSRVCYNRPESSVLSDRTKSLVLVNYFRTIPLQRTACMEHSRGLVDVLNTCYAAAGNRWANFLAVDYYKRSDGGGVFQAIDMLNGMLICGCNDVRACRKLTLKGALYDLLYKLGLMWKGPYKKKDY